LAACFFWTLVAIFIKTNVVRYEFIKSGFRILLPFRISKFQSEKNNFSVEEKLSSIAENILSTEEKFPATGKKIFSNGKKPRLICLNAFSKQQIRLDKIVDVAV
jgi:hypothetical protein